MALLNWALGIVGVGLWLSVFGWYFWPELTRLATRLKSRQRHWDGF